MPHGRTSPHALWWQLYVDQNEIDPFGEQMCMTLELATHVLCVTRSRGCSQQSELVILLL
jgi:hypothetical protein